MPELPEVQTVVNDLKSTGIIGGVIDCVEVYWDNLVGASDGLNFKTGLNNLLVTDISRRAKYINIALNNHTNLLIHLRMTGKLRWADVNSSRDKHEHIVFNFTDGRQLRYHDTRKFGRLFLVDNTKEFLAHLGPEPLEKSFTWQVLKANLKGQRPLKTQLLDQTVVAGLGNIYVDEALWEAKLSPLRKVDTLSVSDLKRLQKAIVKVLKSGLKNMGTTLGTSAANFYSVAGRRGNNSDGLKVFRRTGLACNRCKSILINRIVVGQRSTHFCEGCQK